MKRTRSSLHIVYAAVASVGLFGAGLAAILIAPHQNPYEAPQVSASAAPAAVEAVPVSVGLPVKVASAMEEGTLPPLTGPASSTALEAAFEAFPEAVPTVDPADTAAATHPVEVGSIGLATPAPVKAAEKAVVRPRTAALPNKARRETRVAAVRPEPRTTEPALRKPAPVRSAEARLPGSESLPNVLRLAN